MTSVIHRVALLFAICCSHAVAQGFHFSIKPVDLYRSIRTSYRGESKAHKIVFWIEVGGAAVSLGGDGGSTEYALAHAQRWISSCRCFVPDLHETDTLYLVNGGQFDQAKFWLIKTGLAALPFGLSFAVHKIAPRDSNIVDGTVIGLVGAAATWYTVATVNNYRYTLQLESANKAAGAPQK